MCIQSYPKEYEKFDFPEKIKNNWYTKKDMLDKVGKQNFNIACTKSLNYLQNQNTTSENIIPMFKNLMQNKFS